MFQAGLLLIIRRYYCVHSAVCYVMYLCWLSVGRFWRKVTCSFMLLFSYHIM